MCPREVVVLCQVLPTRFTANFLAGSLDNQLERINC
jgi:hypothetical protein